MTSSLRNKYISLLFTHAVWSEVGIKQQYRNSTDWLEKCLGCGCSSFGCKDEMWGHGCFCPLPVVTVQLVTPCHSAASDWLQWAWHWWWTPWQKHRSDFFWRTSADSSSWDGLGEGNEKRKELRASSKFSTSQLFMKMNLNTFDFDIDLCFDFIDEMVPCSHLD